MSTYFPLFLRALALLFVLSPTCYGLALTQKAVLYAGQDPHGGACEVKLVFDPSDLSRAQIQVKRGARDAVRDAPIQVQKPFTKKLTYSLLLGKFSFDASLGFDSDSDLVNHEHLNLYGRDLAKLTAIFWEKKIRTNKSEEHTSLACKGLVKVSEVETGANAAEAPMVLGWRAPLKRDEIQDSSSSAPLQSPTRAPAVVGPPVLAPIEAVQAPR